MRAQQHRMARIVRGQMGGEGSDRTRATQRVKGMRVRDKGAKGPVRVRWRVDNWPAGLDSSSALSAAAWDAWDAWGSGADRKRSRRGAVRAA
jgi:hypothetical protein